MNKHQILLVEDHDGLRKLLGRFLSRKSEVTGCPNGLEALRWLSKGNVPDLVILDISMPEFSGLEFLSQIRCSGFYRNLPVIVISGEDDPETVEKCTELGIEKYLNKPFNPLELDKLIANTLRPKTASINI